MITTTLRIYIADLAEYNAGRLHGGWIDCSGKDADELAAEAMELVKMNPYSDGERNEHAIHDHEGFGSLVGECTSFQTIADLVEIADELGDEWPAYIAYAENVGEGHGLDGFRDCYHGEHDSFQAYAEELFDETMDVPAHLTNYIDYKAFARDLECEGYHTVSNPNGGYWVFSN